VCGGKQYPCLEQAPAGRRGGAAGTQHDGEQPRASQGGGACANTIPSPAIQLRWLAGKDDPHPAQRRPTSSRSHLTDPGRSPNSGHPTAKVAVANGQPVVAHRCTPGADAPNRGPRDAEELDVRHPMPALGTVRRSAPENHPGRVPATGRPPARTADRTPSSSRRRARRTRQGAEQPTGPFAAPTVRLAGSTCRTGERRCRLPRRCPIRRRHGGQRVV